MRKNRIILTILICLLLLPLNTLAITYGKTGADTNFNGDVNVPSGFNYYINGVVLELGEANTASNIGAQVNIYKQKTGVDLEFRTLKALSNQILVSKDPLDSISLGAAAIDRATRVDIAATRIYCNSPADASGTLNKVEIWADIAMSDVSVATFYSTGGNNFSTRGYADIGTVAAGSKQTFDVSIDVQAGDYIGIYGTAGEIEMATTGGAAQWSKVGDNIPCTDATFELYDGTRIYSLHAYYTAAETDYVYFDINEGNIKLDDLGTPDDNTDLNASISRHGLLPKLPNVATQFLDGIGVWTDYREKTISLLSATTVSFAADGDTTLYTVPTGKRCVLHSAIVVAAADAGATTTVSIGQDTAETDFIPANTLSNLDAEFDAVILQPIPNTIPLKIKSYAAATIIQAQVATQSGAAGNTVYLFGILY